MKTSLARFSLPLALLLCALPAFGQTYSAGQWDKETLKLFASLPVQENGRIKPLSTLADFALLRINSKRTLTVDEEAKTRMSSLEWFLDCLFYPDEAADYKCISVINNDLVRTIGLTPHEKKRDRYSYNELFDGRQLLFTLAQQYSEKQQMDEELTLSERQLINLAHVVREFELYIHFLDFAREPFSTDGSRLLDRIYPGKTELTLGELLTEGKELRLSVQAILSMRDQGDTDEQGIFQAEEAKFIKLFERLDEATFFSQGLSFIPPGDPEKKEWLTPPDLMGITLSTEEELGSEIVHLRALEKVTQSLDNKLAFKEEAIKLNDLAVASATTRGEYSKVPIEISFYKGKFFFYSQWLFVFSFVLVAISWMFVGNKMLQRGVVASILIPWTLLVVGITYRCVIRSRPPVTTLYETILFITAVVVLVALIMEYINRQRIAIALASVLGFAGLFISNKFELSEKRDTMPELEAVLDTNFWLSTHVTIVTIGYAAGILAGAIGCVYILARLVGFKKDNKTFYKTITRMVYGIICFGMLFSFVGTVLGGIWANYSWGRFWGWDPKENGALLIVLWNLAILHSRMGGYIRDLGVSIAAVFGGMVVAFSHWGVNLLGVGLHSYGFTEGIWGNLMIFWATQGTVMLAGGFVYMRDRSSAAPRAKANPGTPVTG